MRTLKRSSVTLLLVISASMFTGCSAFMHGYTKNGAQFQYLRVTSEPQNFGSRRLRYIQGYRRAAVTSFLQEKGMPDYLYEFVEDKREGFILYYLSLHKAFVFLEGNWRPSSARLIEIRDFTEFEKQRFGIAQTE